MNTETKLSPEQSADWDYYVQWYGNNGWEGEEGHRLAWLDLCRKYPELASASIPETP
jgi:hypothetical protein